MVAMVVLRSSVVLTQRTLGAKLSGIKQQARERPDSAISNSSNLPTQPSLDCSFGAAEKKEAAAAMSFVDFIVIYGRTSGGWVLTSNVKLAGWLASWLIDKRYYARHSQQQRQ